MTHLLLAISIMRKKCICSLFSSAVNLSLKMSLAPTPKHPISKFSILLLPSSSQPAQLVLKARGQVAKLPSCQAGSAAGALHIVLHVLRSGSHSLSNSQLDRCTDKGRRKPSGCCSIGSQLLFNPFCRVNPFPHLVHHMLPLIFGVQDTRYSKLYQLKSLSSARTCSDAKMSTVYNWRPPWEPSALWSHNLGMIRPRHKSPPSLFLAFPFSSIIF